MSNDGKQLPAQGEQEQVPLRRTQSSASISSASTPGPKKAAFVHKLYAMLEDQSLSRLIWWSRNDEDGVFALRPCAEFASALTMYFKHGNVSSFVRQLHMYGFHKVFDTYNDDINAQDSACKNDQQVIWEFKHSSGHFKKGDVDGLSMIKRRSSNKVVPDEELKFSTPPPEYGFYYLPLHYRSQDPNAPMMPVYPELFFRQQSPHIMAPFPGQIHPIPPYSVVPQHLIQGPTSIPCSRSASRPSTPLAAVSQQLPQSPQQPQSINQDLRRNTSPVASPSLPNVRTSSPLAKNEPSSAKKHRISSLSIPPDRVEDITTELVSQQRSIGLMSDYLNNEVRSTVSDVMKFSDTIPKLAPALKNQGYLYRNSLSSLQQNFHTRAQSYSDGRSNSESSQGSHGPSKMVPPQIPAAIVMNPELPAQERQHSIHFWESHGGRQPSVFVDPLNPSPAGSVSGPPSPSSSSISKSKRSADVSATGHQIPSHLAGSLSKTSTSFPFNQYQQPQISRPTHRSDSLPGPPPVGSTPAPPRPISPTAGFVRQYPPRSIPDDRSSIPNIAHLQSQLRPSLLEFHSIHPTYQPHGPLTNSMSSNSTYGTLYSAQSSISSISSRNSQGSFSGFMQDTVHSQSPNSTNVLQRYQIPHTVSQAPQQRDKRSSVSTLVSDDRPSNKVAVSSLLESPSKMKRNGEDVKDAGSGDSIEERTLKKSKSSANLN